MNDEQLERRLQSVGKACFVRHYDLFADRRMDRVDAADHLMKAESFTPLACATRVSHARAIIDAGRARDALWNIAQSARVPDEWRKKAVELVRR